MIINIEEVWRHARLAHVRFHSGVLDRAIAELSQAGASTIKYRVALFLEEFYQQLLHSTGNELIPVIAGFDFQFRSKADRKNAFTLLKSKISYAKFSKKEEFHLRPWCAYRLCIQAHHIVCPYCQYSMVDTQLPEAGIDHQYRPALDHFFSKDRYPYLSLTLGNLIPSCDRCNGSQFKHNRDFARNPHLNPLQDKESLKFQLSRDPKFAHALIGNFNMNARPDHYMVELVSIGGDPEKCNGSLRTFDLRRRYAPALNEAFRLRRQLRLLLSRKHNLEKILPNLSTEIAGTVGFALDGVSYKNTVLGKLKSDILDSINDELKNGLF